MSENITASAPKPTLEEVGHRFATWRNQRRARSRIPKGLWQAAVELCAERPIYQVSSALRLSYNDLKWRVQRAGGMGLATQGRHGELGFVELNFGSWSSPSECVVEMEAPNGAKMRMDFKEAQKGLDPVELARAFWRQGL